VRQFPKNADRFSNGVSKFGVWNQEMGPPNSELINSELGFFNAFLFEPFYNLAMKAIRGIIH